MGTREPETSQTLGYEPRSSGPGAWRTAIAGVVVGLLLFALVVLLLQSVQRQRAQQQMLQAERALRQAQLDQQAQQLAAIQQQTRRSDVPEDGIRTTIRQRDTWSYGKSLKIRIGDITGGRVSLEILDGEGAVLLPATSVSHGDELRFAQPNGAPMVVKVIELTNNLIGEDYATFELKPDLLPPATQPSTRALLNEAAKISLLLERVRTTDVMFIRNGEEHSGQQAAEHLAMKWDQAGGADDPSATAELFIQSVGTRSSMSGEEYLVRHADGTEIASAQWLRQLLAEIEAGAAGHPATRAADQ